MCEFCTQHGEGKVWYLNAKNYSTDLLSDVKRKNFIETFYDVVVRKGNREVSMLEKLLIGRLELPQKIRNHITKKQKEMHFGQVLPFEDVEQIFSRANSITRIACGCAWAKEKKESRVCFGVSFGPPDWYDGVDIEYFGNPTNSMMDKVTLEDALKSIAETDKQGMVHSVWTFETPFIGAICNCDKQYCLAMRMTVGLKAPVMFRAEYIAELYPDLCNGCMACANNCQFSAISYNEEIKSCVIDKTKCYGCGVCRAQCEYEAIKLTSRKVDTVASLIW
jgi:ferredoxin